MASVYNSHGSSSPSKKPLAIYSSYYALEKEKYPSSKKDWYIFLYEYVLRLSKAVFEIKVV